MIFEKEKIKLLVFRKKSQSWMNTIIIPIPKSEESLSSLKNYRPITLIESPKKLFVGIIVIRIKQKIQQLNLLEQRNLVYQPGISCQDVTFRVRLFLDSARLLGKSIELTPLDIEKAFDSVPFSSIVASLRRIGCPIEIQNLFSFNITHWRARIKTAFGLLDGFNPKRGIEQGGMDSPLLWLLFVDPLLEVLQQSEIGYKINGINNITFVDDITLISDSRQSSQQLLDIVSTFFQKNKMKINEKKTKLISSSIETTPLILHEYSIIPETIISFTLLGSYIDLQGRLDALETSCSEEITCILNCMEKKKYHSQHVCLHHQQYPYSQNLL